LYLINELPEGDRNNLRKVMRYLEEKIIIESLTQPTDMDELRREIGIYPEVERVKIQPLRQSSASLPQSRLKIPVKKTDIEEEEIKFLRKKVEKDDPEVVQAFVEMEELRKLIDKPLVEIYKREIEGTQPNRFMPIRVLSEFLENGDFNANELALFAKLVKRIVNYNKGSIERVLTCLYIESELSKKYKL
jgi:hypothetical protein